jgi:hypothetical protein
MHSSLFLKTRTLMLRPHSFSLKPNRPGYRKGCRAITRRLYKKCLIAFYVMALEAVFAKGTEQEQPFLASICPNHYNYTYKLKRSNMLVRQSAS